MFKIGDKVRVKSNLEIDKPYNGCYFTSEMKVYKGKTATIVSAHGDSYEKSRYKLDIDKSFYYSNDMLESINDSDSILPYKVGDKVRIIDEMPEYHYGISADQWLKLLGKSGKIKNISELSYLISIPELSVSFWLPLTHFKKESTLTSENSIKNVSKLIEYVSEIELPYCKKQIYTV